MVACCVAGAGGNGAIIHYRAEKGSCKKVDKDTLLLLDSGGQFDCGTTDVTRTMHFGTPTDHQKMCFTRVLQVLLCFLFFLFFFLFFSLFFFLLLLLFSSDDTADGVAQVSLKRAHWDVQFGACISDCAICFFAVHMCRNHTVQFGFLVQL